MSTEGLKSLLNLDENFDDLIKKENLIYGISLTEMKIKKKDKEVINTIKPQ